VSGKRIGVELTKWVEGGQLEHAKHREERENSYLELIGSENEPRPEHIGRVWLHVKPLRNNGKKLLVSQKNAPHFRTQLFEFLAHENEKPEPSLNPQFSIPTGYWNTVRSWSTLQGAPVKDFTAYPILKKYLNDVWIFPRECQENLPVGFRWILFETPGGAYTAEFMVQAAIENIWKKINKYKNDDIPATRSLGEFDLLCHYCDEALLYNTPTNTIGFGFPQIAAKVKQSLASAPGVFDRIFLFSPYEEIQAVQVYYANS